MLLAVLLTGFDLMPQAPAGAPAWIWAAAAAPDEERFFRREFAIAAPVADARLAVSCDNHCRVFVNGERVLASDTWEVPVAGDVTAALRPGANVLAVHAANDGGPAGLVLRLSWREGDTPRELVSDASWVCGTDDQDGWDAPGFAAVGWLPATELARLGDAAAPWTRVLGAEALAAAAPAGAPQVAEVATGLLAAGGGAVDALQLLQVPAAYGSWVALCADDRGRLYAAAERGGLFRVRPAAAAGASTTIERVPVALGGCHGLLWFRSALYAVQNGGRSGLYRLTDTDGDDVLDRSDLLQALDGEGEHGPHSVVVAPDGEHLLVVAGNHTRLPPLAASRVATNWREDRLLPRLEDPNDYWEGHSPPGGWVCQVTADGARWELLACGFRNPYDLVVLPNGLVVTFDADMEWDMGLPWYRPTRLLAVESGVDYGWRIGSAKWPADWPEAPPPLADLGPGSPVGMAWAPAAGALLALDWTFGTVYREAMQWWTGAPLPLTDVAVAPATDGRERVYLLTGGRGLPSQLLAVRLAPGGAAPLAAWAPAAWSTPETRPPAQILADAAAAAALAPKAGERAAPHWVRARIALERLPVGAWRELVLADAAAAPPQVLCGLLALARQGGAADLTPLLAALARLPFAALAPAERIGWLRVHALALQRLGPPDDALRAAVAARLLPLFPTGCERQDADLAELLACVDAPGWLDAVVPALSPLRPSPVPPWADVAARNEVYGSAIAAMLAAPPPTGQIALANALRTARHGWTPAHRRTLFAFLADARRGRGGSSYDGYLRAIAEAAWAGCTPAEQVDLAELVGAALRPPQSFRATPPRGPGRAWQLADGAALLREPLAAEDRAAGHNLFHAVGCASCHWFAGEGGNRGPDLTSLGNKFTAAAVFEAIVEPSRAVSDQYAGSVLTRRDGSTLFGAARRVFHGDREVWEVVPAVATPQPIRVPVAEVLAVAPSPLSPMPAGLVNGLSAAELRQLLAFLLSRGEGLGPGREQR